VYIEPHQKICVYFIDRLRDEIKFKTKDLLVQQINKDVKKAKEILS